ncbi:cystathionine beta-synthase [Algoriphagus yeomjeoni]|uniref:cystathionine beta-synthase n=1 Tax=Algoriphagus yeomjeoni TaxID=291403 RepID=UPI003CE57FBF
MFSTQVKTYLEEVIHNMPSDWLTLTTHRLDIYNEELAKTQFLDQFESLFRENNASTHALNALPTTYDYIRLGHPLSCVLEWAIAKSISQPSENIISFSSKTTPILAVLRKNLLENRNTQILHTGDLPDFFDAELVRDIYGYKFDLQQIEQGSEIPTFEGSTIFISHKEQFGASDLTTGVDFSINLHSELGTVLIANGERNSSYISEIQHVRRRETIAMTPENCLLALKSLIGQEASPTLGNSVETDKASVLASIQSITGTTTSPLAASSGLSMQYAIMMGLVHDALENHPGKAIKFIVPPNCYGGTNDQARRVAACIDLVEVVDLPVDGDNDMVQSLETILTRLAAENAIPYIIAEIPTNPRVEVPNLEQLKAVLSKERKTPTGENAIASVFILDQTFCPNYLFLGEGEILSTVKAISYASGSKFPSGGKCTAGYCVANNLAAALMDKIAIHLQLCDNEATSLQYELLAKQLPSMNQRIKDAYVNTHDFVNFIQKTLPTAKINFVSKELADQGFTPSVFSLDLPTKGNSPEEKEAYKRALNLKLINMMITEIPDESKYCVSYGQLKGCYWTIPATSTQGTTKEGDKDYIIRASLSPIMDLKRHKEVFQKFVDEI